MELNPDSSRRLYRPAQRQEDAKSVKAALDAIDDYLAERAPSLFGPVLDHLREVGEARSCTEIDAHFKRNFDVGGVTTACEYLADQGLIGKASTPVQLTKKSNVEVQELAFFYVRSRTMPSKPARQRAEAAAARTTIAVQGARVHNLKNISLEIPRDQLIVVTGLSGSGKSSLAFDTIYAEGQRRYMESLSSYAKRFVAQVAKPDVDFVFGLSPVISIEQKTIANNPRSTVGTMTDIASYLNLLFATIGQPHCPRTGEPTPSRTLEPDPRGDPVAAGRRGDRAAGAGVQGLRRGARLRLHRGAEEGLPEAHRRRQAGRHLRARSSSTNRRSAIWTPSSTASSSAGSTRKRSRPASPPRCWWAMD